MNHDLIAAGHPPLRYELATFHAREPKHWRDGEAQDRKSYEARLWLVGQIAAADASLSLLQARAAKSHTVSRWPELSAYDCSSCHHALGLKNTRRTPSENPRQAIAPLSSWNTAGLLWIIRYRLEQGEATSEDIRLASALDEVRMIMESGPTPNAARTAAAVDSARQAIVAWVDGPAGQSERSQFHSDRLGRIVASAAGKTRSFDTWESSVQLYLAAIAARESWPGGTSGPLHDVAESLRRGLAYPDSINGPEFSLRERKGPSATRSEVRRTTIELTGWLGPVMLDGEPMPVADESLSENILDNPPMLKENSENTLREQGKPRLQSDQENPSNEKNPEIIPPKPVLSPDEMKKLLEDQSMNPLD